MISHVFVGVSSFERGFQFYSALMGVLGLQLKFCDPATPWAGWQPVGVLRPLLVIGHPFDGRAAAPGNGQMIALLAASRTNVDEAHAVALSHGGVCEGPPGLRPQYHANYYGGYFRDLDGNKICVCCHDAP